ncbi:MAG: CpaF family protein [Chloroflexi bacterium]|nr:CpaF family protein [Chloroflexota bacterium]
MTDSLPLAPLDPLLKDPTVLEIMVNGPGSVYVDRGGHITQEQGTFDDAQSITDVVQFIAESFGRHLDESHPILDVRFDDGSRMHIVMPPISPNGPSFVIRKVMHQRKTLDELVELNALTPTMATFLAAAARGPVSMVVAGGSGSGKTTMLEAIIQHIPLRERLLLIDSTFDVQVDHHNVTRLEARPPNTDGQGGISPTDLVISALKMRPDRIILNEIRGGEALHFLQALNTGHDGSMFCIHAANPQDVMARFETLCIMENPAIPVRSIRQQMGTAFALIVMMRMGFDGVRRVTRISEVTGTQGDIITMQDIFVHEQESGFKATGVLPTFLPRLHAMGITRSPELFAPEG